MRETRISLPLMALVAATRGVLGVGIGMLVANRFGRKRRVTVGSALAAVGAIATIPLAFKVFAGSRSEQNIQPTHATTMDSRVRAPAGVERLSH